MMLWVCLVIFFYMRIIVKFFYNYITANLTIANIIDILILVNYNVIING